MGRASCLMALTAIAPLVLLTFAGGACTTLGGEAEDAGGDLRGVDRG